MARDPNTILLKCKGHREEYPADAALKPGHLVVVNSTGEVLKHAVAGQRVPVMIACEDALQGKTKDDAFAAADPVPVVTGVKGDVIYVRLQSGQNAAKGDGLYSAGDGTFAVSSVPGASTVNAGVLYKNTAASAAVTNTTTETLFDKSYTLPANALLAGDVIEIDAQAIATATNSTDTLNLKLYIGGIAGTNIAATGAVDVANNDVGIIKATLVIRTIGASGTFVAEGYTSLGVGGTVTAKAFLLGSTAIDTTASKVIGVSATWSVANAGNSCRLDVLTVTLKRDGQATLMYATEAKDATSAEKLVAARVA